MKKILIYNTHKISYHNSIYNEIFELNLKSKFNYDINFYFFDKLENINKKNWEQDEKIFDKFFKEKFKIKYPYFSNKIKLLQLTCIVKDYIHYKPDIVYVQGYSNFIILIIMLIAKISFAKIMWRGEFYKTTKKINYFKKIYLNIFFKFCDIIFFSTTKSNLYIKNFTKKKTIPMLTSAPNFYYDRNLKLNENIIKILFVGDLSYRKGIDLIIDLINISKYKSKILFIIAGNENENKTYLNRLKKLNIRSEYIQGATPNILHELYNTSSFLILLSRIDPSPKVCNEAFNCGLPMLLSNQIGSIEEFKFTKPIILETNLIKEKLRINFEIMCQKFKIFKNNYRHINKEVLSNYENAKSFFKGIENLNF